MSTSSSQTRGAKVAVPSLLNKRLTQAELVRLNILSYDGDNLYPQRFNNAIDSSGTADACSDLAAKHFRGLGFVSEELDKMIVNDAGQTLGDIHGLLCRDRSRFRGYAFHVQYNGLFEIAGINHVPFETIRLSADRDERGLPKRVKTFEDWSAKVDEKLIRTIDLFNPDKNVIARQIASVKGGFDAWNGQIFYFSEDGHLKYPKAICDSVFEDVITDAGVKIYKNRQVSTGFMCDYVVKYRGEFADENERALFIENLKNFSGFDRSHRFMILECPNDESAPIFEKLEAVDNDKKFQYTEESARENIIRRYGQFKALHSIATAGSLGLTKEIEEARVVYDERTSDIRASIANNLAKAVANWHEKTPDAKNFEVLPLTGVKKAESRTLADVIGVGGLQSMQSVVESKVMNEQQKINYLRIAFSISEQDADAIVKGTPIKTA